MESRTQLSKFTFIGMTCALVMSVRNIPDLAASGWTMLSMLLIAVVLYAIPISMISGEYAGMFPGAEGGIEGWNTNALGPKWGNATSWLTWVQMFPGMVMISSALAPLFAIVLNKPELGENNIFTFAVILIVYWTVTLLNFKFDMAKFGGQIGVWLGVYIPMIMMLGLGIAATIKTGLNPDSVLGAFDAKKLVPDTSDESALKYLAPIMFIFTGIEMSAVHVNRLKDPVKDYISGLFIALIAMFGLNLLNGFIVANTIPNGKMELNNISQPIEFYCKILGISPYLVNVFSIMVILGVIVQLSAWSVGPSMTIVSSARRGVYPPKLNFWKTNKHGISTAVVLTQAVVISIFACMYILIPGVNEAFLTLVTATTVLYSIAYIIMAVGIIKLRKEKPDLARPFKIGSDGMAKFVAILLIVVIIASVAVTLSSSKLIDIVAILVIVGILFAIPFIIYSKMKPEWKEEVEAELAKEK